MDDFKMLVVGDVHLSDSSPGNRTETYTEDLFAKCEEVRTIAKNSKVDAVLFLGDIFHKKQPNLVSHRLVQRFAAYLASFSIPVYILVGNHDISDGSLTTLARQPIGIFSQIPNVQLLTWDTIEIAPDVLLSTVPGVPIRSGDWLQHYNIKLPDNEVPSRLIVAAHQDICPDLNSYPPQARDHLQEASQIASVTNADIVLYGHMHDSHGVYKKNGVVFSNLGSLCRLTVGDTEHLPHVAVYTIKGDENRSVGVDIVPITSVRPAADVFLLEEVQGAKEYQKDIDSTVKQLQATKLHKFSIEEVISAIKVQKAEEPVKNKAIELLEKVS